MTLGDGEINSRGAKSSKMGGSLKNNNNNSQDPLGKSHIRDIRMIGGNLIFMDVMRAFPRLDKIQMSKNLKRAPYNSHEIYFKIVCTLTE